MSFLHANFTWTEYLVPNCSKYYLTKSDKNTDYSYSFQDRDWTGLSLYQSSSWTCSQLSWVSHYQKLQTWLPRWLTTWKLIKDLWFNLTSCGFNLIQQALKQKSSLLDIFLSNFQVNCQITQVWIKIFCTSFSWNLTPPWAI